MKPASSPNAPVLTCWKDIANYFGKGVRTVQRWERRLGLPVRRPDGVDHKTAVIAYPGDLDDWLHSRWSRRSIEDRHAAHQSANDGKIISSEISDGLRVSRELQRELRELRKEHRDLIDQLSLGLTELRESCQQSPWHFSSSSSRSR
jgi:hypothetical protein